MLLGDGDGSLERRFGLGSIGAGQEHLAGGDVEDRLPLRWYRGGGHTVAIEQVGGQVGSTCVDQPAQVHFMEGVQAGEPCAGSRVDQSPRAGDGVVEQGGVPEFAGCSGELYQGGTPVGIRRQFHSASKSGNGGGVPFDLAQLVAVYPEGEGEQVLVMEVFGQPQRPAGPSGGTDQSLLGQDVAE